MDSIIFANNPLVKLVL